MPTRKFHEEFLKELTEGENYIDDEDFDVVQEKHLSQTRWQTWNRMTFHSGKTGQYWQVDYGVGSTENCDNDLFGAFKDKDGYVACSEVEAYQVLVTRYREKKDVKQEVQTV
jgi:hypothetical protein